MLDITTLAAWGEFLGGIAVVVSLIYLASQIRQNSRLLRTSTASATSDISGRVSTLIVQDAEVARIFWEGSADRDALATTDRQRFEPDPRHDGAWRQRARSAHRHPSGNVPMAAP